MRIIPFAKARATPHPKKWYYAHNTRNLTLGLRIPGLMPPNGLARLELVPLGQIGLRLYNSIELVVSGKVFFVCMPHINF